MNNSEAAARGCYECRHARTPRRGLRINYCRWPAVYLVLGVLATGCSSQPEPTYPVHGVVRLDGAPLTHGNVMFESVATPNRQQQFTARGVIQQDGTYCLSTFGREDGAVAGRHQVAVVVPDLDAGDVAGPQRLLIPARYTTAATSGLEREVRDGDNPINLELSITP